MILGMLMHQTYMNHPNLPAIQNLPELTIPHGQLIFDESRTCMGFPVISQGRIKVFKSFANGRELLLYGVGPQELCVVSTAALLDQLPYQARAVAQGEVHLRLIPPALFDNLMDGRDFRRFVLVQYTQRMAELMSLVDAVYSHRLDQRLAARLLAHVADTGTACERTHQELADELGSVREVISRMLRHFADQGLISLERGSIWVLDPVALQQLVANPQ